MILLDINMMPMPEGCRDKGCAAHVEFICSNCGGIRYKIHHTGHNPRLVYECGDTCKCYGDKMILYSMVPEKKVLPEKKPRK